jgi:hypothetical protein
MLSIENHLQWKCSGGFGGSVAQVFHRRTGISEASIVTSRESADEQIVILSEAFVHFLNREYVANGISLLAKSSWVAARVLRRSPSKGIDRF